MTTEEFIRDNPLDVVCAQRGIVLKGQGNERKALCVFHKDRTPSLSVNVKKGKWTCYAGCGGGTVIDLLMKLEGLSFKDFARKYDVHTSDWRGDSDSLSHRRRSAFANAKPVVRHEQEEPEDDEREAFDIEAFDTTYSYTDQFGREVFQVLRYSKPHKTFRQRHRVGDKWVYSMDGVQRVLYNLPGVVASPRVLCCEGERDANSLCALGFMATTNPMGAGKWLDSYSEHLAGKDVVIFPDNDKDREDGSNPGRDHAQQVFDSVSEKAKSVKIVWLPKTVKDVTDYIATFKTKEEAKHALDDLIDSTAPCVKGQELPLYTMAEIAKRYKRHTQTIDTDSLDLGKIFPSWRGKIRPLVPGEVMTIVGDTGGLKTALMSIILMHALPMPSVFFEIELPAELMFERMVAARMKLKCTDVEQSYKQGDELTDEQLNREFPNLLVCDKSDLSLDQLDTYIGRSELRFGERAKVVGLDYLQLLRSMGGDRYERMSNTAERIKVLAKQRRVILIDSSQVSRPKEGETQIGLHSAKDSGSIENSAGLVISTRRDEKDKTLVWLRVLKNTKGTAGHEIACNIDGERMLITERAKVDVKDIEPKSKPDTSYRREPHANE